MFQVPVISVRILNCVHTIPTGDPMAQTTPHRWLHTEDAQLADLQSILQTRTNLADCPLAATMVQDVPVYDCHVLRALLRGDSGQRTALLAEWAWVWEDGPGILVLKETMQSAQVVDAVTARYFEIIGEERSSGAGGDHFAKAGANDRIWNALEKLCLLDPTLFARYYANDMIALASEAWLGPAYQITSGSCRPPPSHQRQRPHGAVHQCNPPCIPHRARHGPSPSANNPFCRYGRPPE